MASTLDGGGKDRSITRGHGPSALGPGDTSATGTGMTERGCDAAGAAPAADGAG
jgi:hypothetical protein